MFIKVTFNLFVDRFKDMGRANHFSYEALRELFEWYEELEEGSGEEIELDVISICCDWAEYTPLELKKEYDMSVEELRDETSVIELHNGNFLVMSY